MNDGLVERALEIAGKRAAKLREIETALLSGDTPTTLKLLCEYLNVDPKTVPALQSDFKAASTSQT